MDRFYRKAEYVYRPFQVIKRLYWRFLGDSRMLRCTLPWGTFLYIDPHQNIGKSIYTLGLYDLILSESINRIISPGDTVIDVGANIGYVTNLMAVKCGSGGKVYSFEPHPELISEYLSKNIQLLREAGYENVLFHPYALSDLEGDGMLFIPKGFTANNGIASLEKNVMDSNTIAVNLQRLDNILAPDTTVKLMKVDVEGHEYSVFCGAESLLSSGSIENIIYEEHVGVNSKASVFLKSLGFKIFKLNRYPYGVRLSNPTDTSYDLSYEVVNYLASRDPDFIHSVFSAKGWTIYKLRSVAG